MSINYRKRSLTDGNRALQLFTDRYELTRHFAGYLNDDPASKNILCFYGDGGNGKSLLLKFLREKCCKRLRSDIWQGLKPKTEAEIVEYIEFADTWEFAPVPAVLQDFGLPPNGDDQPQDPFYGLLMLRRNLSTAARELNYHLRFPLYDFACIWYLHQKHRLSSEKLKELFPQEEFELVVEIVNAVSNTSWGAIAKAVLSIFSKHLGENFHLYLQQRGLKEEDVQAIRQMDVDTELIFEMPRLLAQDLNAAMSSPNTPEKPERIVLFFDTHEAFWGIQRDLPNTLYFQRDEWLRYLLAELELSSGIVAVVAGREAPRWQEADKYSISQEYLDTQLVNHLCAVDADEYLQRAGISDQALRQSAIAYASVAENEVHPFLLGLSADVLLQNPTPSPSPQSGRGVSEQFEGLDINASLAEKAKQLTNRLLKYVNREICYAVHALSACRAFNYEIYDMLGRELDFHATKPSFQILTEFSFVWEVQARGKEWYRIHDLLRRLNYEGDNEITQQAHQLLEQYYRQQQDLAEAIYHVNRLDWWRGVDEWVKEFERALELSRYERCRQLLEVRNELIIKNDFQLGRVSRAKGDYFAGLARYPEAEQEYREAVVAYEQVLGDSPDYAYAHNDKGLALAGLGDLQARFAQHEQALATYQDAIASFNQVLQLAPDDVGIHNNKGIALAGLGELQVRLAEHDQALASYQEAIASYNQALQLAPDDAYAHNDKGLALAGLGELQVGLAQHKQALATYQDAIASFNQALQLAPDDVYAHNNKGIALAGLGELQVGLAQHEQALASYQDAIASYNQALLLAPDFVRTHNNKGIALVSLGELQVRFAEHEQALANYQNAIASYNQALQLAPDYVGAHNNKGGALQSLGKLQASLAQHEQALASYQEAIASFNQALERAPDYVGAHNNKGLALRNLGDLQATLAQHQQALATYQDAIASLNQALQLAPNHIYAHNNKGLALRKLGDLLLELSDSEAALNNCRLALAEFNRSLEIAPGDEYVRNLRDKLQEFLDEQG